MDKTVVLAGGSGYLGQSLSRYLKEGGYSVVVLTRGMERFEKGIHYVHWDGQTLGHWIDVINGSYALINLTGKSINCLYNEKNRSEIIRSRVDSVNVLHECVLNCENPPEIFVQAGSIAIFGDTKIPCDEDAPYGNGFSAEVCKQWEASFFGMDLPQTRQVMLRIGIVLGDGGGALEPFKKLTRFYLGGTIGSGKQYISWVHLDDLMRLFMQSLEDSAFIGVYNMTAPKPVPNKIFMQTLRKVMKKGWAPPTPAPFVKLGAYLVMRTDPSVALEGMHVIPKRILDQGFVFKYPQLESALKNLL
ncbi:uncharacterized protein (TIGR01777 family) [Pullulanibacillus pueri]|uniref:Epimerase n=1 Tax=Pullulanibacillus pueri TaxID=1437324 RepID=A0A8J3ELC0_9BACL|nr:TIGR01777 family oxidoreductase [Pullulanibacillus pueri]MBM7681406.1 uncharacterized protein (TIGR01777 family) [Pullulanibacillus pueri]GGH78754.1 epimerase [Pullulanibacillus pueri]